MKYHAIFIIFEKASKFKLSSAANYTCALRVKFVKMSHCMTKGLSDLELDKTRKH